jgi:hypothetical protein
MAEAAMDKQFLRILMLSILLFAGANLAEAIDHDYATPAASHQGFVSELTNGPSADSARKNSIEGRRFMKVIAAEEDAAVRRRGDEGMYSFVAHRR